MPCIEQSTATSAWPTSSSWNATPIPGLAAIPPARLARVIPANTGGQRRLEEGHRLDRHGQAALELYGDDPAVPFLDLADELATEIALLRVLAA